MKKKTEFFEGFSSNKPLERRVRKAASWFRAIYHQQPTHCRVNPATAGSKPPKEIDGIVIIPDKKVLLGDYVLSYKPETLRLHLYATGKRR